MERQRWLGLGSERARPFLRDCLGFVDGGGRGIRTPVTLAGKAVFKTACFNRSHIPPRAGVVP
jgi:hypothetical protein